MDEIDIFKRFLVVDTETTNTLDEPLCYDVGFAVVDRFGAVYEKYSFVVAEIFLDRDLMSYAYFADKIEQYWQEIKAGKRKLAKFSTIRRKFAEVCKRNQIDIICAHNAYFDYRSLNLTQRYITASKYRYFLPFGTQVWDTLKMSREVLKNDDAYGEFCYNHDFLTSRLCKQFTAEVLYRFIVQKPDFEEAHTGLEDVLIEKEIFAYCLWRKPNLCGKLWK